MTQSASDLEGQRLYLNNGDRSKLRRCEPLQVGAMLTTTDELLGTFECA